MQKENKDLEKKEKTKSALGGIFANAISTTPKYHENAPKQGRETIMCPNCRATRPADSKMDKCAYCGTQLFRPTE